MLPGCCEHGALPAPTSHWAGSSAAGALQSRVSPHFSPSFATPDYPYCLVGKELRSIIRSLLGKASGVLELFFDHCIYTMLQELDKASGQHQSLPSPPLSVPPCLFESSL